MHLMTPIERAARALYKTGDFDPHQFGEDAVWPDLVDYVRAVLSAIREPSHAMLDAHIAAKDCFDDVEGQAYVDWHAMIDAAMAE